ncbi:hypothetical protein AAVH_27341 [Aphelenchoides avenae]|nr:hypothetical protein AAVH_27341 [Aphelenchus avenae]
MISQASRRVSPEAPLAGRASPRVSPEAPLAGDATGSETPLAGDTTVRMRHWPDAPLPRKRPSPATRH